MTTAHHQPPADPSTDPSAAPPAAHAERYYQGEHPQPADPYAAASQDLRDTTRPTPPAPAAAPLVPVETDLDFDATDDDDVEYIRPFVVKLGGQYWSIQQPDGGTVMDIDEARTPRAMLALIFDDQWADVAHLIDELATEQIRTLVRQFRRHFELDEAGAQASEQKSLSRADRRNLRRRRRKH